MGNKPVLNKITDSIETNYTFYCPACKYNHPFRTETTKDRPTWKFNGDMVKPTFKPSLRCLGGPTGTTCHLVMTDGKIKYCGDCPHDMAGKTVDMIPIDET